MHFRLRHPAAQEALPGFRFADSAPATEGMDELEWEPRWASDKAPSDAGAVEEVVLELRLRGESAVCSVRGAFEEQRARSKSDDKVKFTGLTQALGQL